ncbi:MAG: hypothetical protein MJZ68_01095 [archaeon]|nr:hypothetical protein [archaeon]
MNRKGLTAIVDAMFFIALIGIATLMVTVIFSDNDMDIEDPSDTCRKLFGSYIDSDEVGYKGMTMGVCSVSELTASSILLGDGIMEEYLKTFLDRVYPWNGAYRLYAEVDGKKMVLGTGEGKAVSGYTCTYPVWYTTDIRITLQVY